MLSEEDSNDVIQALGCGPLCPLSPPDSQQKSGFKFGSSGKANQISRCFIFKMVLFRLLSISPNINTVKMPLRKQCSQNSNSNA